MRLPRTSGRSCYPHSESCSRRTPRRTHCLHKPAFPLGRLARHPKLRRCCTSEANCCPSIGSRRACTRRTDRCRRGRRGWPSKHSRCPSWAMRRPSCTSAARCPRSASLQGCTRRKSRRCTRASRRRSRRRSSSCRSLRYTTAACWRRGTAYPPCCIGRSEPGCCCKSVWSMGRRSRNPT